MNHQMKHKLWLQKNQIKLKRRKEKSIQWRFEYANVFFFNCTLQAIADCIKYLLTYEGFFYVLPGNLHNDKIEHHFGYCRGLAGLNRHLDCPSFLYIQQGYITRHLYLHYRNKDGSHNIWWDKKWSTVNKGGTSYRSNE